MKKLILMSIVVLSFMSFTGNVFACVGHNCPTDSNVQDSNDGNKGYILTYDCEKGNVSVGQWTDPSFLKGDKGDKGDTGEQGIQGIAGQDGRDGVDGINGVDGKDGQKGDKGDTGSQGEVGATGQDGTKGDTGENGEEGKDGDVGKEGKKGTKGDKGKQGIQGEQGKGLEDRYELIGEVRLFDTKRTTWSVYAGHDFNNDVNIIGAKCVVKIGRSYEERRLDELEKKIDALYQEQEMNNVEVVPYGNTGLRIKTNF